MVLKWIHTLSMQGVINQSMMIYLNDHEMQRDPLQAPTWPTWVIETEYQLRERLLIKEAEAYKYSLFDESS